MLRTVIFSRGDGNLSGCGVIIFTLSHKLWCIRTLTPVCPRLFGIPSLSHQRSCLSFALRCVMEVCLLEGPLSLVLLMINIHIKYLALECPWIFLSRNKIWNVSLKWYFKWLVLSNAQVSYSFHIMGELHLGRTSQMAYMKTEPFVRTDSENLCGLLLWISAPNLWLWTIGAMKCVELAMKMPFRAAVGSIWVVWAAWSRGIIMELHDPLEKRDMGKMACEEKP